MQLTTLVTRGLHQLERAPQWLLVLVFVVGATVVCVLMLNDVEAGMMPWLLLLGAFTVGVYRPAREVAVAAVAMALVLVALLVGDAPGYGGVEFVISAAVFGIVMMSGWTLQSRRQRIEAFGRERLEAEHRAAADERLRIAQEMHDVVAHSLGVIAVQAGVGMHVLDSDPAEARRSFENISRTSRSSLAEIRGLLGVVRRAEDTASYTPAPGLADLPQLARDVTAAGLPVDVRIDGDLDSVPPGVGLAAYRIAEEALTNSLRHANARQTVVRLDNRSGLLLVEVTDDGQGPSAEPARGHGLVGMRERVAVYGGSLATGAGPEGGFRVTARLPYDDEERVT